MDSVPCCAKCNKHPSTVSAPNVIHFVVQICKIIEQIFVGEFLKVLVMMVIELMVVAAAAAANIKFHLQATLSKLLTYGVLWSTQPPTLRGTGNEQ